MLIFRAKLDWLFDPFKTLVYIYEQTSSLKNCRAGPVWIRMRAALDDKPSNIETIETMIQAEIRGALDSCCFFLFT